MKGYRWVICALLFLATTINYMDRQVLGLLAPTLGKEIGWSEKQYGDIVTAFQAAYALGLLAFGRLIDAVGTRHGYAFAMIFWSLAAMGHALVRTVTGFGVVRFALGFGEAGNFPAAIKAVAEWFPRKERALATGIFNSGSNIGAMVAPLAVPWLVARWGWPAAFVVLGAAGFAWLPAWYGLYGVSAAGPAAPAEDREALPGGEQDGPAAKLPWRRLIACRQTWAYVIGMALSAPVWWFYLYWLPKFLNRQYGLELVGLGPPLFAIYTLTCAGSVGGGWLSSHLLRRGWSVNAARKTALLLCACCTVPVVLAMDARNCLTATALIGLAAAAHQGWSANLFSLVSDLFPKSAVASVVGFGAMFGSLTAMAFAQFAGHILQTTGSYRVLFMIAGSAYVVAFALLHALVPKMQPVKLEPPPV